MCNQTVGLVAAELERQGIATVAIQLQVRGRASAATARSGGAVSHGYPLDTPGTPDRQHWVIEAMLRMLEDSSLTPPALLDYEPE